ncbi:tsukushi isoform X2 [Bombina bombina]|uniref:tsukushi isoform X2 n=1 Tax=Bombina bombina TaxID=8345 RepID=UPI00235AF9ED|nr:tsukushi isoform X2 [Bombina bombina]
MLMRGSSHSQLDLRGLTMRLCTWVYLLLTSSVVSSSKPCFPGCHCEVESFGLFDSFSLTKVDCSGIGPHIVPVSIPLDTAYLDLSSNKLVKINESVLSGPGYTTLVNLNLSYNQIVKISSTTFSKLRYLETLDLSHNMLEMLPVQSFFYSPIVDLDLSFNKLLDIKMGAFTLFGQGKSMTIDLSNNFIGSISKGINSTTPNIQSLTLSGNRLQAVPSLQGIPLRHLNLDKNPIAKIEAQNFLGLKNLAHLSLSSLQSLKEISPYSFKELPYLQTLDLSNNHNLKSINSDVFFGLDSLQELNLSNSGVSSLPKDILPYLPSIKSITWGKNTHCVKTVKESQFNRQTGLVRKEILLCRDDNGAVSVPSIF